MLHPCHSGIRTWADIASVRCLILRELNVVTSLLDVFLVTVVSRSTLATEVSQAALNCDVAVGIETTATVDDHDGFTTSRGSVRLGRFAEPTLLCLLHLGLPVGLLAASLRVLLVDGHDGIAELIVR